MLTTTLIFSSNSFSSQVSVNNEQVICEKLSDQADSDCANLMCGNMIQSDDFSSISECVSAPDYAEAAQGTCEKILPNLIEQFNKRHPRQTVACEQ